MKEVRARAIREIDTFRPYINPVDQATLALEHDVPHWRPIAYAALCQREQPITAAEGKRLGIETLILLMEAREAVMKADRDQNYTKKHKYTLLEGDRFETSVVQQVVDRIFPPPPPIAEVRLKN